MKARTALAIVLGSASLALDRLSIAALAGVLIHLQTSDVISIVPAAPFDPATLRNIAIVPITIGAATVFVIQYATARFAQRRIVEAAQTLAEQHRPITAAARRAYGDAYASAIRGATCIVTLALALALLLPFASTLATAFAILIVAYLVPAAACQAVAARKALREHAGKETGRGLGWTRERRHRAQRLDQAAIGIALIAVFATQIDAQSVHYSLVVCALVLAKLASVVRGAAGHIRHVAWAWVILSSADRAGTAMALVPLPATVRAE